MCHSWPPLQVGDITVTLRQKLLTIIAGHYSQVKIHLLRCTWRELPFQISISIEEVYHQLSNLQSNKASGPDKIPVYFLKRITPLIALILFLFSRVPCHQTGKQPTSSPFTKRLIVSAEHGRNYRPVSLTSIYCKALECIIYSHILYHLQTNPWNFI